MTVNTAVSHHYSSITFMVLMRIDNGMLYEVTVTAQKSTCIIIMFGSPFTLTTD